MPFRNEVIDKWNERANATSVTLKKLKVFNQSATKQIDQALQDRDKLVARAHTLKADITVLGGKGKDTLKAGEVHEGIFDDTDFYQQLLREFINSKMTVADPEDPVAMTRQFLALQQLKNKTKKMVDTKASKGRKIKSVSFFRGMSFSPFIGLTNFSATLCVLLDTRRIQSW